MMNVNTNRRAKKGGKFTYNFVMIHVIRGTCDTGVLSSGLPNQLENIIDARQDIVHENDSVKVFTLAVSEFVQGHHGGITDFGEVFDTVGVLTSRAARGSNGNAEPHAASECVEYP